MSGIRFPIAAPGPGAVGELAARVRAGHAVGIHCRAGSGGRRSWPPMYCARWASPWITPGHGLGRTGYRGAAGPATVCDRLSAAIRSAALTHWQRVFERRIFAHCACGYVGAPPTASLSVASAAFNLDRNDQTCVPFIISGLATKNLEQRGHHSPCSSGVCFLFNYAPTAAGLGLEPHGGNGSPDF
jgi:hypothetical protein